MISRDRQTSLGQVAIQEALRPLKAITKPTSAITKVFLAERGLAGPISPEEAPQATWVYIGHELLGSIVRARKAS